MCYLITPYHSRCGHYGRPGFAHGGEQCIISQTQKSYGKTGCFNRENLGVATVGTLCPECEKARLTSAAAAVGRQTNGGLPRSDSGVGLPNGDRTGRTGDKTTDAHGRMYSVLERALRAKREKEGSASQRRR